MKRLAFNGGEVSPSMAFRSDMDVFSRACSSVVNFEIMGTGGVRRRRALRHVAEVAQETRLIPFIYSSVRSYIIELSQQKIIIRDHEGTELETIDSNGDWAYHDLNSVRWQQCNGVLFICSATAPVMSLVLNDDETWSFERFAFKVAPWESIDEQDEAVVVQQNGDLFSVTVNEEPMTGGVGDLLRVSFWLDKAEAREKGVDIRERNWTLYGDASAGIQEGATFEVGDCVAVCSEVVYECYICTAKWEGSNDMTEGCGSPANYKDNFLPAEDLTGFDDVTPIYELSKSQTYSKGAKVKIKTGYWTLYTCVKAFGDGDYVGGKTSPEQYKGYFIKGVAVGDALTCKGTWKFYCSGTWYGSYEVRRNYENGGVGVGWETVGESASYVGSPTNNIVTGDEDGEECYLRLFLTTVRYKGEDNLAAGWPSDDCSNRLIVNNYKHDMVLKLLADGNFSEVGAVNVPLASELESCDWSWEAFNGRNGYATIVGLHQSRLVLAATSKQPQTLWLSKVDDLSNFDTTQTDDSGLLLTMQTSTQAGICWLHSKRNDLLIGTEDGEWVLSGRDGMLTAENAHIVAHGGIGSDHVPAIVAQDRVLYCERGGGRVYQYGYNYESDGYRSEDLTIFAEHIGQTHGGILHGAVKKKPQTVAMFVLSDGQVACMTYNTMHNVHAWWRIQTEGEIESVCVLPDGVNEDRVIFVVNRDGQRYLEYMDGDSGVELDSGQYKYTSELRTTAFSSPERNEDKHLKAPVQVFFQNEVALDKVQVTTDGSNWVGVGHKGETVQGWAELVSLSSWSREPEIGVRVNEGECEILCMQM